MSAPLAGLNQSDATDHEENAEQVASQLTSPTALRKLVMNYLVHHCYSDTAQAFADDGTLTSPLSSSAVDRSSITPSSSHGTTLPKHSAKPSASHPLSAPPLSRQDSSMEVEVDSHLSLARGDSPSERVGQSSGSSPSQVDERGSHGELSTDEMHNLRIRKEIREHILSGRIRQSIDLCNRYFPAVLTGDGTSSLSSVERESKGNTSKSIKVPEKGKDQESTRRILPSNPTSLDPAHLSLNLQIQAFIENVRTASTASMTTTSPLVAANSSPQGTPAMPSMYTVASTPGIAQATLSRSASPAPSSSSSSAASINSTNGMSGSAHSNGGSSTLVNPVLQSALRHAQAILGEVQKLPEYWRAMYLKELESVTVMLAYTDLERSPVRKYLDQNRRVALAEQINSAIMFRTGMPSQPLIESAVRQTTFCWSTLAQENIALPPDHPFFSSGTASMLGPKESSLDVSHGSNIGGVQSSTGAAAASATKNKGKALPAWDLHTFLRER